MDTEVDQARSGAQRALLASENVDLRDEIARLHQELTLPPRGERHLHRIEDDRLGMAHCGQRSELTGLLVCSECLVAWKRQYVENMHEEMLALTSWMRDQSLTTLVRSDLLARYLQSRP